MSTVIQITPKSGITVGTTAVTSGTVGRVFFQGAGDVVQQNTNFSYSDNCLNLSQYAGGTTRQLYLDGERTFGMDVAWTGVNTTAVRVVNSGTGTNIALLLNSFNGTSNNAIYASNGDVTVLNGNIHIGNHVNAARLDIKAQGALSTDVAFRVRNSVNTQNSFQIDGLGQGRIRSTSFIPKFSISYVSDTGADRDAFIFTQNVQNSMGRAWTFDAGHNGAFEGLEISNDLTGNDKGQFTIQLNNFCFGTRMIATDTGTTERRVLRIANGVAPTTSKADEIKFYSADIVAGNAAPHFRTEVGDVIKLYKQSSAGIATVADIVTVLTNLGLLG